MLKIRNRADSGAVPKLRLTWDESPHTLSPAANAGESSALTPVEPSVHSAPGMATKVLPPPMPPSAPAPATPATPPTADTNGLTPKYLPPAPPAAVTRITPALTSPLTAARGLTRETTAPKQASPALPTTKTVPAISPAAAPPATVYSISGEVETVGVQLLHCRAKAHISVEEIAKRTRVSPNFIVNLEQGNYDLLPADPFCLWEIERLCFEYDIDAEPMKELFEQESRAAGRETGSFSTGSGRTESASGHNTFSPAGVFADDLHSHSLYSLPGMLIGILVVALLVLVVSAFFYQQSRRSKPSHAAPQSKIDISQLVKPKRPPIDLLQIPSN